MGTRKSVDKILDEAANILETRGFTTGECWNPDGGSFCALGAIARAAYPKSTPDDMIGSIAYTLDASSAHDSGIKLDPKYVAAVKMAALTATRRKTIDPKWDEDTLAGKVYDYNDTSKPATVVKMLRRAAERARKEAASA